MIKNSFINKPWKRVVFSVVFLFSIICGLYLLAISPPIVTVLLLLGFMLYAISDHFKTMYELQIEREKADIEMERWKNELKKMRAMYLGEEYEDE